MGMRNGKREREEKVRTEAFGVAFYHPLYSLVSSPHPQPFSGPPSAWRDLPPHCPHSGPLPVDAADRAWGGGRGTQRISTPEMSAPPGGRKGPSLRDDLGCPTLTRA